MLRMVDYVNIKFLPFFFAYYTDFRTPRLNIYQIYLVPNRIPNTVRSAYYEQNFVFLICTSAYCEHHSLVPDLLHWVYITSSSRIMNSHYMNIVVL